MHRIRVSSAGKAALTIVLVALVVIWACDKRRPAAPEAQAPAELILQLDGAQSTHIDIPRDTMAERLLVCRILDEDGFGISGVRVQFTRTLGNFGGVIDTTDAAGEVHVAWNVINQYGDALVIASYAGLSDTVAFTVTGPLSVRITSISPSSLPADNGVSSCTVRAEVLDVQNEPAFGFGVFFGSTGLGVFDQSNVDVDTAGIATGVFRAQGTPGVDTVFVTTTSSADSATVAITPLGGNQISIYAAHDVIYADGPISLDTLYIQLRDSFNVAVPNAQVSLTTDLGVVTSPVQTDTLGVAVAVFNDVGTIGTANVVASALGARDTVQIQIVPVGTMVLTVDAEPDTIVADGASTSTVTALLMNAANSPVPNVSIRFVANLGVIGSPVTTDANGVATTYIEGQPGQEGRSFITAFVGTNPTVNDTTSVHFLLVQGNSLDLSVSDEVIYADNWETVDTVFVVLHDSNNAAIPSVQVALSCDLGVITSPVVTDTQGRAIAIFNDVGTTGTATIVGSALGASDTVQVDIVPVGTRILTLTADPDTIIADGSTTSTVRAQLINSSNNPLPGISIRFMSTMGVIGSPVSTDSSGIATTFLEGQPGEQGPCLVTAWISDDPTVNDTITVVFEPAPPPVTPDSLVLTTSDAQLFAGVDSAVLTALVFDQNGLPVPDGTQARFTTTAGVLTNYGWIGTAGGVAKDTIIASTQVVTAVVTAIVPSGGLADTLTIDFIPGQPSNILVDAIPDTIPASTGQSQILSYVTDMFNNPVVDGTPIDFAVLNGLGNINPQAFTAGGFASATFIAGVNAGVAQIGVTWGDTANGAGDTIYVYIASGGPNSITLTTEEITLQVQGTGGNESAPITATVLDAGGNPVVDGTPVFFEILVGPGGGENWNNTGLDTITVSTLNGAAIAALNSGTAPGTVSIRVSSGSVSTTKSNIVIVSGPPVHILVSADLANVSAVGSFLTYEVAAQVTDAYGNQVVDSTVVWFSILPANRGMIVGEAYTRNMNNANQSYPGVAFTDYFYPASEELKPLQIIAQSGEVWDTLNVTNPIYQPAIILTANPGFLILESLTDTDSSRITAQLFDGLGNLVEGGGIIFQSDLGQMRPSIDTTNVGGQAYSYFWVRGDFLPADPPTTVAEIEAFLQGYQLEEQATTNVTCYRDGY